MRSRKQYIVTKKEVHGYAEAWVGGALALEHRGYKCTDHVILQILLIAASRVVSLFAACRDLADAPSDQTVRDALSATLPDVVELEKRLNRALCTKIPKALRRKSRVVAIDLTLIPYHGRPAHDEREIYRSKPKSGTSHFHAYASAVVVHKGLRYTLALTRVERREKMEEIVKRLRRIVRSRGVKVKYLLLDKGFYSVSVIRYLKKAKQGFIIPVVPRGRKKSDPQAPPSQMRALLKRKNGHYRRTIEGTVAKKKVRATVTICVATKSYVEEKMGKRKRKKLLFAVFMVRMSPTGIRETYRKRFGIETSYRQMNEARIRTCTRDPRQRLLFVGIALVLRNVWVWLHFLFAKGKHSDEPQLFLELLRFKEMLLWLTEVVQQALGAHKTQGVDYETYQRLTAKYGYH
jgi:hypothetical protein